MLWMRTICGRLKSDYRITKDNVYNNFPWPEPSTEQKEKIIKSAHAIIEARKGYSNISFADMYGDKMFLFEKLVNAHKQNDIAVKEAYGFKLDMQEEEIITKLFGLYKELTQEQ